MAYNLEKYSNLTIPGIERYQVVKKTEQSMLLKSGSFAVIVRPMIAFGTKNCSIEMARRIESVKDAKKYLRSIIPDTEFVEVGANEDMLIARIIPWYDDVVDIQETTLWRITKTKGLWRAIRKIALFTISEFIRTRRAFDFFCIFSEYRSRNNVGNLLNLIIPRNIFIGKNEQKEVVIFADSDWYVRISDTPLSGFEASSYKKRITQGMFLLCITVILSFWGELASMIILSSKR